MCFLLFKDNCITNKCSLCFCVNMSVWSKMLITSRQSLISPAASSISLLQTNAIFMYSNWGVCLHSVWIYLKPCVCLEVQAGNSPTNLVNVCVVSLLLHSTLFVTSGTLCSFHKTFMRPGDKYCEDLELWSVVEKERERKKTLLKRNEPVEFETLVCECDCCFREYRMSDLPSLITVLFSVYCKVID